MLSLSVAVGLPAMETYTGSPICQAQASRKTGLKLICQSTRNSCPTYFTQSLPIFVIQEYNVVGYSHILPLHLVCKAVAESLLNILLFMPLMLRLGRGEGKDCHMTHPSNGKF